MSTPDNPESGQLTRRQMRQIRTTASTPVVGSDTAVATQEPPPPPLPRAPLPRPARPVAVAPAPGPDAAVDLGVSPLTRRQARQQERIRTASVPVITPDVAAAHLGASPWAPPAVVPEPEAVLWTPEVADERSAASEHAESEGPDEHEAADGSTDAEVVEADAEDEAGAGADAATGDSEVVEAEIAETAPADVAESQTDAATDDTETAHDEPWVDAQPDVDAVDAEVAEPDAAESETVEAEVAKSELVQSEPVEPESVEARVEDQTVLEQVEDEASATLSRSEEWLDPSDAGAEPETRAPRVGEHLGDNLLATQEPADVTAVSFDELLTREGGLSGSVATPHALILNHVPEASPLSAVTSTGEVIVTGIYNLPDGLGSQGHAHGAADGKEIDATLIDGELPASSSPTPIAASAAISTVRGTGEIIRPPAPEKSGRLMLALMITAGALALALVGLLTYVVVTGVFN